MHAGRFFLAIVCALAGLPAGPLWAQDNAGLQRALDRPVEMSMTAPGLPIGQVFDRLALATGVQVAIDDSTYQCLPYGAQTKLQITLRRVTLRNALTPILAPQALQWVVEGGVVRILPSEPLYRMGRRATFEELQILGRICSSRAANGTEYKLVVNDKPDPASQLGDLVAQLRVACACPSLTLVFQVPPQGRDDAVQHSLRALPGSGAQWLDALTSAQDWTWYLSGQQIIILDRRKQIERQLGRQVSLRYQNEQLSVVLTDLARKGRIQLSMEPGVLGLLPPETRNSFSLMMADATIAQALEVISGATGLTFTRTGAGIHVEASGKLTAAINTATSRPRASFMIRTTVPGPNGTSVELFIRSDDLPDDVRAVLEAEKTKFIESLRAKLAGAATTRPAVAPATQPAPPETTEH